MQIIQTSGNRQTKLANENKRGSVEYVEVGKQVRKNIKEDITNFNKTLIEKTINENKSMKVLRRKINGSNNIINKVKMDDGQIIQITKKIIETTENSDKDL